MEKIVYNVKAPFILEAVVKTHGWFQLVPFYWREEEKALRWATRLKSKAVLLTLSQPKKGVIEISGTFTEQRPIIEKFEHVFNLHSDLTPFYRQCANNPALRQVKRLGMGRIMRSETVYQDVFKSICGTNVMWKQAVKMINTVGGLGKRVAGSDYHTFPDPSTVLKAGEAFLVEKARVGYRSRYLIALCERMVRPDEQISRVEAGELYGRELMDFFTGFMGIGKITARYLSALYGYFGELAVDSAVYTYMSRQHFNGRRPTEKQIQAHYARFGEWRYLAYWMEYISHRGWVPEV